MKIFIVICVLGLACWQGCSQGRSSTTKDEAFNSYINANAQHEPATNQQSNAIVNVAF